MKQSEEQTTIKCWKFRFAQDFNNSSMMLFLSRSELLLKSHMPCTLLHIKCHRVHGLKYMVQLAGQQDNLWNQLDFILQKSVTSQVFRIFCLSKLRLKPRITAEIQMVSQEISDIVHKNLGNRLQDVDKELGGFIKHQGSSQSNFFTWEVLQ